jgi:hypothetical protein
VHSPTAATTHQIGHSACVGEAIDRWPESERDDLPRGESYPLTRFEVDGSLRSHSVERVDLIYFLRGGQRWLDDSGHVVDVRFRAAGDYAERLELRVFSVPARLKAGIAAALLEGPLDEVGEWMANAVRSETPWRSSDHALTMRWIDGALHRDELDGIRARGF